MSGKLETSKNFIETVVEINGKRLRVNYDLPEDRIVYNEIVNALFYVKNFIQNEIGSTIGDDGLIDVSKVKC